MLDRESDAPDRRIPRWRREEMERARYERLYAEIEARLITEFEAEGFLGAIQLDGTKYKPSYATVNALVEREMKRRGE